MVSLAVFGTWNLEILQKKMLRSDWLIHKFEYIQLNVNLSCYLKTNFEVFLDKGSDSDVHFGVTSFLRKFDDPCNISMTSYGSRDHKFENVRLQKFTMTNVDFMSLKFVKFAPT